MARPVIGICTPVEPARWSGWDAAAYVLPTSFVEPVRRAGALALLLAPDPALVDAPDELLDRVDGLMLAGGADVDPAFYGAQPDPSTLDPDPARDAFEIALVRRALERDLPLLAICRGMQILNVACGGTLHQHLPRLLGHEHHRRVTGSFDGSDHDVRLRAGSLAARAAGEQLHATKSHHHQGVDRVGDGLEVSGWSLIDDLPEAIEAPLHRFALGVQWHPEADERSRLIAALVEEAAAARAAAR
ncbi:MAG TPA: gamma-glutamyl-gamma-aminobutyrate hydrolase family protein [Solirubrobacteraceae bacterium]|nr:gamma-glutamyl-gamma-aminobutyrate hydrolase family protein [Solirubrobacteraceae bacterium]